MQNINNYKNINKYYKLYTHWEEFWGAYFLDDGGVFFQIFTFPDVKSVKLEIKAYNKSSFKVDMTKKSECIWQYKLQAGIVSSGDRYHYLIEYANGEVICVKDPCSMWQDSYFKWSRLYNHKLFKWSDTKWMNGKNPKRISHLANNIKKFTPVDSLKIYELHIGTFTQKGTFISAIEKLEKISNELNFNAIEIMPVENTYSFNWGYDGVDKYAPNHTYGTPDDLKQLINFAHNINLNVIMDVVPNHLGPDITQLPKTGPYIEGENCFGYKFNFEKDEYSKYVRHFIIGSTLNWVMNYHCDGLRVDMTKFMCSDYTMKQMVAELNYYSPHAFLIAEDGRDNDNRVTKPFTIEEQDENYLRHDMFINRIREDDVSLSALGFDTEWDFPFHKQIASSVLGCWDGRIKSLKNFDYSLRDAQTRVKYVMSHDEIGNIDGTRLITKIVVNELNLCKLVDDCENKSQIMAHISHKLLVSLISGELENMSDNQRLEFYKQLSINSDIPVETIFNAYINAVKMHKLVLGKIYSIPGPKMIFQGDESANLSYFKFFRKFSIGPENYLRDKGYEPGLAAFLDSKLTSIKVCDKYSYINKAVEKYVSDLNLLNDNNIALTSGHIEKSFTFENTDIHAIYSRKIYNEIFSISNFSSVNYLKNYGIMFPKGKWREIFNSDDIKYAGTSEYLNKEEKYEQYSYISIPAYGIVFFEKII
jgi:1,4-alpha-glucan branching enzyme